MGIISLQNTNSIPEVEFPTAPPASKPQPQLRTYSAALASWEEVQKFKLPKDERATFESAVAELRTLVEGPAVLSIPGELELPAEST